MAAPLLALLSLALVACGTSGDRATTSSATSESGGDELTWWRDAEPIVRDKCGGCHVDGGIAPFALDTHAAFVAFAPALAPAIESGTMPPWSPDPACNDYEDARSLTLAQEETLLAYLGGEMPEGDPADAPPADDQPVRVLEPDVVLEMPEAYAPSSAVEDDYRCFLVPWPEDLSEPRFVTGFEIHPGERRIAHHVIVYAVDSANLGAYVARDAADPGPGYTCFGGPGPTDGTARWVGGWVPGMVPFFAPDGVGQQIDPGTTLVMQVHYHPIGVELADRSAVALELATSVTRRAEILPLADIAWLVGNGAMLIPAGEASVTHAAAVTHENPLVKNAVLDRLGLTTDTDLEIINVGAHMHLFGTRVRVEVRDPGGADPECVLDIPRWDFNWQRGYDLVRPVTFRAGRELGVQCWWDNSAGNQPIVDGKRLEPADLDWGEGTLDEMCLGVLYVTRAEP